MIKILIYISVRARASSPCNSCRCCRVTFAPTVPESLLSESVKSHFGLGGKAFRLKPSAGRWLARWTLCDFPTLSAAPWPPQSEWMDRTRPLESVGRADISNRVLPDRAPRFATAKISLHNALKVIHLKASSGEHCAHKIRPSPRPDIINKLDHQTDRQTDASARAQRLQRRIEQLKGVKLLTLWCKHPLLISIYCHWRTSNTIRDAAAEHRCTKFPRPRDARQLITAEQRTHRKVRKANNGGSKWDSERFEARVAPVLSARSERWVKSSLLMKTTSNVISGTIQCLNASSQTHSTQSLVHSHSHGPQHGRDRSHNGRHSVLFWFCYRTQNALRPHWKGKRHLMIVSRLLCVLHPSAASGSASNIITLILSFLALGLRELPHFSSPPLSLRW